MSARDQAAKVPSAFEMREQPLELDLLLRAISGARRMASLYGSTHPNSQTAMDDLIASMERFLESVDQATCVFTRDTLMMDDRFYSPSPHSRELFHRLRLRGVMALTFMSGASPAQALAFIAFLGEEPREVRRQGGARDYLRKHGVTHIVATEAIYSVGDYEDETHPLGPTALDPPGVDRVIGAAIAWLMKKDEEEEEKLPCLPITEVLSDPDSAARLIREAVTKLHASRTHGTDRELASEVIHGLKTLTTAEAAMWDEATPKIRKAISKLPIDMRPAGCGFALDRTPTGGAGYIDVAVVEELVERIIKEFRRNPGRANPIPKEAEPLFGARTHGLLSNWKSELEPSSILRSCGKTYETLMAWGNSASEHGRIAHALSTLIARAVEIKDYDTSLMLVENLLREACRPDTTGWRNSSAKAALEVIDAGTLRQLVEAAMQSGSYHSKGTAASLVETLPKLALTMAGLLGGYYGDAFDQSLRCGLVQSGHSALPVVTQLLRVGEHSVKVSAIEVLIGIGTPLAMKEVAAVVTGGDATLAMRALQCLARSTSPHALGACASGLNGKSSAVRHAALKSLGARKDRSILPEILRLAEAKSGEPSERVAAIRVIGEIGAQSEIALLEGIARYRPLLGRKRHEDARVEAESAIERIKERPAGAETVSQDTAEPIGSNASPTDRVA